MMKTKKEGERWRGISLLLALSHIYQDARVHAGVCIITIGILLHSGINVCVSCGSMYVRYGKWRDIAYVTETEWVRLEDI